MKLRDRAILTVLVDAEMSGLPIMAAANEILPNSREIGVGSLYRFLRKLEGQGFTSSRWGGDRPARSGGACRRYYVLTETGGAIVRQDPKAWMASLTRVQAEGLSLA